MSRTGINFMEKIAEARVEQITREEQELEQKDQAVKSLVMQTNTLLDEMLKAAAAGDEARRRELRNEVVILNLRLVTTVLKKYGSFSQDKFQNGCIGLLKAADTFKKDVGVPFKNYACFCIESEIRMAWGRQNRAFEGKKKGFLDSLDAPMTFTNGDTADKHELIDDPFAAQEFDDIIREAELDTLFYDIIIPCIEEYGTRAKEINMEKWRELEIQYFIELSMEDSRVQRLTFTTMAQELGTVTQNIRTRHKKVLELVRKRCREYGYDIEVSPNGRARMINRFEDVETSYRKNRPYKNAVSIMKRR